MEKDEKITNDYNASQITVLEGLDPVRKRPGMYIGGTGPEGLHHLIWEVVDNSLDEAMAGHCKNIIIHLLEDNKVSVLDDGRGIPVDIHPTTKKSALETALTVLHAGGKFGGGGYKISGGLHGVGVSVVNALSTWVQAEVYRDGNVYQQTYHRGKPEEDVKPIGKTDIPHGTKITFQPDPTIFPETDFSLQTILDHLRQQAYLTKAVKIIIFDWRDPENKTSFTFYFEGGIVSYANHINHNKDKIIDPPIYIEKDTNNVQVEVAFAYTTDYNEHIYTFANNIPTPEGGMHLTGFRTALTRVVNDYARKNGIIKDSEPALTGEDAREGLTAVISVKVPEPQFEGQTKSKLGNPEVRTITESIVAEGLNYYLEEHPAEAKKIIEKCSLSARARMAARAARETVIRKGALEGMTLPGKLADCSNKNPADSEIYIVEGDSAGGCFSGDTKIALTDGRNLSFTDLIKEHSAGKKNYCYTVNNENEIEIAQIQNPRLTKKNTSVIKITLDNNEEIICTPDHKFMLRDGSYLEAKSLKTSMSLMPLNRKMSEIKNRITISGYEMILNPATHKWVFTHMLSDQYNLKLNKYKLTDGNHKHHQDYNKLNNNPENILRIPSEEHLKIHRQHISKTLHRPEVIEKCRKLKQDPKFKEKMSKIIREKYGKFLSEKAKKQWSDENYKAFMAQKYMEFYLTHKEYRENNNATLNQEQKKYWSIDANRKTQSEKISQFFKDNPDMKEKFSAMAKKQWENSKLLTWRKQKTSEQWTDEFREKRKASYDQTYLKNSMQFARKVYDESGDINNYEAFRKNMSKRNNNILSFSTLTERFFSGDQEKTQVAVKNYNHKIKSIEYLSEKIDVYDIEVPKTHNFALASGIFVHNSAKQGRDRRSQAILPLKGKILNVERARLDRMLASDEIKALIVAMGAGIGEQTDINKIRYHRIIIMTDADVDGSHIRTLLLTFYYRHFPEIIQKGYLYIAQPPLYAIMKGKDKQYAYSDEQKEEILKKYLDAQDAKQKNKANADSKLQTPDLQLAKDKAGIEALGRDVEGFNQEAPAQEAESTEETGEVKVAGVTIQRYKGLGEMNPEQLWDTTMNPETRMLWRVNVEDASRADEIFTMLMGEDVPPRKRFIQTHAKTVKNLDV